MDIRITAKELINKGVWDKACKILGISIWAINEGMDDNSLIYVTEEQAKSLGLI